MATVIVPPKMHLNDTSSTYTFSSMPRALLVQRRKLRDYNKADRDERIQGKISGPTQRNRLERSQYAPWTAWTSSVSSMPNGFHQPSAPSRSMDGTTTTTTANATPTPPPPPPTRLTLLRAQEHLRRTRAASSFSFSSSSSTAVAASSTPLPVAGRKHIQVQTQLYLEELKDTIEESDATCQTDGLLLLDRPTPLSSSSSSSSSVIVKDFVSHATAGIDAATQIEPEEIFDFEMESAPVLEVMVGKAVEFAVIEVLQEEDLANIRRQQRRFHELRNACQSGEQWIKEQEDKINVMNGGGLPTTTNLADDRTLSKVLPRFDVRQTIHSWSFVSDPIEKELERAFLPWVLDEVEDELASRSTPDGSKNGNSGSTTRRSSET